MINENITRNYDSIANINEDNDTLVYEYNSFNTDYISSGTRIVDCAKTGDITTISTSELSESKSNDKSFSVSSGDLYCLSTVSANQTSEIDYSPYMETINLHLDKIDKSLALIAFFIIFAWCASKIVNAVRSFCGIGLK